MMNHEARLWRWTDLWSPPYCVLCRKHYVRQNARKEEALERLCPHCRSALPRRVQDRLLVPTLDERWIQKGWMDREDQTETVVALDYTEIVAYAIRALKFHDQTTLGNPLGMLMSDALEMAMASFEIPPIHAVIPMPLHRRRRWERGYNQAELLARVVAKRFMIPLEKQCLIRKQATARQSEVRELLARIQNVQDAFVAGTLLPEQVRHVVLVDDVLTTGATLTAAARVLLEAGVERVTGLVVASNRGEDREDNGQGFG